MGEWSPSHLVVAAIAVATIIGQLLIVLTRLKTVTERLEKRIDNQDETIRQQGEMFYNALERLEERMDKRFVEVVSTMNQRLSEMNEEIRDVKSEMNQRLSDMNEEIRDVRSEVNQRLSDMNASIQQMNQNHIEHLNRHHAQ